MEYVVGPVIALLISMKFTDFTSKRAALENKRVMEDHQVQVSSLLAENTSTVSQRKLQMMMPMAKSVQAINSHLGL